MLQLLGVLLSGLIWAFLIGLGAIGPLIGFAEIGFYSADSLNSIGHPVLVGGAVLGFLFGISGRGRTASIWIMDHLKGGLPL